MIKFILWTIFVGFLASLIAAIISLFNKKYRKLGTCYLWWVLFPFIFPWYAKKNVVITHQWKSWLLVLISPCALSIYLFTLLAIGLCISMDSVVNEVPGSTDYHNASDLTRATGVEFPEVLPVDSLWHYDWCNHYTRVKFVPIKPLTKSSSSDSIVLAWKIPAVGEETRKTLAIIITFFPSVLSTEQKERMTERLNGKTKTARLPSWTNGMVIMLR